MSDLTKVCVDVLGADEGPSVILDGCTSALNEDKELHIILCGPESIVTPYAQSHERCTAKPTTQEISLDDHPARAVRKKKDSSIVVGCRLVKEGEAEGFFSVGSTGACLAAATLVMGRIKGIPRPALATVLPCPTKPVLLCDVGANADCKPEYLVHFARMASVYAERIIGIENPSVALLNIGEEETKGSKFAIAAHELLKDQVDNFVGNAEGRDIMQGTYDVIVCDGFTGNVCLKTIEGSAKAIFGSIKKVMFSSLKSKLGALCLKSGLTKLAADINPDAFGGAPLLGVKGACIVGHGSSNAEAIKNGILVTAKVIRLDVSGIIEQTVRQQNESLKNDIS